MDPDSIIRDEQQAEAVRPYSGLYDTRKMDCKCNSVIGNA